MPEMARAVQCRGGTTESMKVVRGLPATMAPLAMRERTMRANMFLGMAGAAAGVGLLVAAFGTPVSAATATANLGVSATVTNNCTISTTALAFGSYDPVVANASTNLDGTGAVSVACTKG